MRMTTSSRAPRRLHRPRILAFQALPTLVTLGNVLAGLLAISYLVDAWGKPVGSPEQEHLWAKAAWVIFVGMVCDALDGRVARLTGTASAFGAELDSLADVVTFGVAPALLAKSVALATLAAGSGALSVAWISPRLLMIFAMIYLVGAALRLARYNVESLRVSVPGHVTRVFRGLPSPGSAGVIAGLVVFRGEYGAYVPWLPWVLFAAMPALGLLMISRFPYPHLVNRLVGEKLSPLAILVLVIAVFLTIERPEAVLGAGFVAYALSGPFIRLLRLVFARPRWRYEEDEDEDEDPAIVVDEAETARDDPT